MKRSMFFATTLAAALFSATAFADTPFVETDDVASGVVILSTASYPGEGESQSITIEIKDGDDIKVNLNGEEVPDDRIEFEDGLLKIYDEDGNEVDAIRIGRHGWPGAQSFRVLMGDDKDGIKFWTPEAIEEPRVMIGVHLGEPGPALERHLGLDAGTTTMIIALYEGLPAHEAGLGEFDIITKIDGKTPAHQQALRDAIAAKEAGDELKLNVIHQGKPGAVTITLGEFDAEAMAEAVVIGQIPANNQFGWVTGPEMLREFNVPFGMGDVELDEIFVAPGGPDRPFVVRPDIRPRLRAVPEKLHPTQEGVDEKLSHLDERLAELEKMLNELLREISEGEE